MNIYRVTLITAAGDRVVLPFIAPGHQRVEESLDKSHPDRLFTAVMVQRPRSSVRH